MKSVKTALLFTLCMVVAFLCGKFFTETREKQIIEQQDPPRVFIEQLKTKINITKNDGSIEIFLNGEKMSDDIKLTIP